MSSKKSSLKFVILLGFVSLLADITYEGARSISGPYLAILGASASVVGIVSGFGELIGYALRLASGYLTDRTQRYWTIVFIGYTMNLLAVPALALTGHWEFAAVLLIFERTGKAIRTPARDVMLSQATKEMGHGWGFGLHEAMDQIGAMMGPMVVAAAYYFRGEYRSGFAILAIPALLALAVLLTAQRLYPNPRDLEKRTPHLETKGFSKTFWLYLVAASLIAVGYADFPLIAYHFEKTAAFSKAWIPLFYSVAMGVDALSALLCGYLFDRVGFSVLIVSALLATFFAPLVFLGGFAAALAGMALWGVGMGAQESILRAAIAQMVPSDKRGTAYGLFNGGYGVFWFLGSAAMGMLYDFSIPAVIAFSIIAQLSAVPFLVIVARRKA